jgi:hypothetical protein
MPSGKLYSREEKPFDKPWEDWSAEWWKWLLSISDNNNPVNDEDGELQGIGQHQPNVFFLGGTHQKKVERRCRIPPGKAILFPVATMSTSYLEFPNLHNEADLRRHAEDGSQVEDMKLIVDDEEINKEALEKYRVKSPLFELSLPEKNILLHVGGGETRAVSDGYWAFLKPLTPGEHTLTVSQKTKDHPASGTLNCKYEMTYHLMVK